MKVSELAEELEVPASTVLAQCARFGIDASWAGAELDGTDIVILRSELAGGDALDLTPADPPTDAPASPAVPAADQPTSGPLDEPAIEPSPTEPEDVSPAPLPPTAVGSRPDLIDEVTPEPEPEAPASRGPGFQSAGGGSVGPEETRATTREPPAKRRLDRSARNGLIALALGAALLVGSNFVDLPAAIAVLWLLGGVLLVVAVVDAIKGRRHAQTHPDRITGVWLSAGVLVLAVAGLIGLAVTVNAVVQDPPPDDAPLNVGDLAAVQSARWGYQRLARLSDSDWERPARDEGSCWTMGKKKYRADERVDIVRATETAGCDEGHTMEVSDVWAINRDADAPYPGAKAITAMAIERCGPTAARLGKRGITVLLVPEYPTSAGWDDGDHDVACVLVTEKRQGSLLD